MSLKSSIIGYKLRKHIANNLKRRSQAVKTAVKEYNLAAANFDSSIKEIDAKEVLEYVYIGQFDILRCSRRQITAKPWSRPAEREALISFFRLQRAREEIVRLEVEMRRLTTYMRDFKLHAERISSTLEEDNRLLAHQFKKRFRLRASVDDAHFTRLVQLKFDYGLSGTLTPGIPLHLSQNPLTSRESGTSSPELGNHDFDPMNLYNSDSGSDTDEEAAALASEVLDIIASQDYM